MSLFRCDEPTDVGSTRRKPLSPTRKAALYEAQRGICPLCDQRMMPGEKLIDEHLRPLGLGGTNDLTGRAMVHKACADNKTYGAEGDLARIAKAKAQKRASLGFKAPKRPIQSAGFPRAAPQCRATGRTEKDGLPALGRRSLFVPEPQQKDA